MGARLTLEDVERAASVVSRHLPPTPVRSSLAAGEVDLRLKLECWQPTGSFKVRGATHLLATLGAAERRRGVVAASAGNHALGVAFAAARLGDVKATLFVPTSAPRAKVDKLRRLPVELIEYHGNMEPLVCIACWKQYLTRERLADGVAPACDCGEILKPNVVLFGEPIPWLAQERAEEEARTCGVLLVVGTSAQVSPACDIPRIAKKAGAAIVEINTEETPLTA